MFTDYSIVLDMDYENMTTHDLALQIDALQEHMEMLEAEYDNMMFVFREKVMEEKT